jgi:hypothetical protein
MKIPQRRLFINNSSDKVTSLLPEDYRRISYIEGTSGAYIDTCHASYNNITSYKLRFFPKEGESIYIFGNDDNHITIYPQHGNYTIMGTYSGYYGYFHPLTLNEWHEIELGKGYIILDDVKKEFTKYKKRSPYNAYLFARNNKGNITCADIIIDAYQAYDTYNDDDIPELVRNMVACERISDGTIGMYDLCGSICPLTGTPFYINAGTGEFLKGEKV